MDLKALIAKMDVIEKKQILNEDAKTTKTSSGGTVTRTEKGSVHKAGPKGYGNKWDGETQDQAAAKPSKAAKSSAEKKAAKANDIKLPPWKGNVTRHSSNKGAEKDDGTGDLEESFDFKGAIASALLKEFGLDEAASNPWTGKDPAKAAAWDKLSPEVQAKIGGADPTDPAILSRMVNGELGGLFGGGVKDANPDGTAKPAPTGGAANPMQKDPATAGAEKAAAASSNPYASANVTPDVAAGMKAANAPSVPAANPMQQDPATMAAAKTAEPGQSGQPAKPKATPDPRIVAMQQQLIAKGAKIKDDGIMGPQTQAAMKQYGMDAKGKFMPQVAAGAPSQSDAETARLGRQAGQANPEVAKLEAEKKRFMSNPRVNMQYQANKDYVASLDAKIAAAQKSAPAQSAQPAAPLKPGLGSSPMRTPAPAVRESEQHIEDNAVLNLIRNAFKR